MIKENKEYPLLGKDDVCRLMELSYEMGMTRDDLLNQTDE